MSVEFQVSTDGFPAMLAVTNPRGLLKAQRAALLYASRSVKPQAGKSVAQRYGLGSRRVQEAIKPPRLKGADTVEITLSRQKPPTLRAYGAKPGPGGRGVIGTPFRGRTPYNLSYGFWVQFSGSPAPGTPVYRYGPSRGSIRAIYGPTVGSIIAGKSEFGSDIQREIGDRMLEQYGKGVERELARMARGYGG